MMDGYIIKKNTNLQEGISGSMLFEYQFSDYELYQILESNGYKTTNQNKDILKKGLQEGRYYIEDELDSALLEEFKDFLNEEPIILGEDILTEGKILNKIRWKLALFSLRFLTETSINAFFIAYYANKETGEATEKGREFCRKPRKEKLAKMRELANGMKEEDKNKVINSQAAKMAEKSGIFSFISAGIAGIGAGIAAHTANMANSAGGKTLDRNDTDVELNVGEKERYFAGASGVSSTEEQGTFSLRGTDENGTYSLDGADKKLPVGGGYHDAAGTKYFGGTATGHSSADMSYSHATSAEYSGPNGHAKGMVTSYINATAGATIGQKTANAFNLMSSVLASIAGILFGAMWAGIIVAGLSTARGVLSFHKASTLRRDEIMAELKGKMDPAKARELAKQYKAEFKAEKKK